jgi:hypothetical protein
MKLEEQISLSQYLKLQGKGILIGIVGIVGIILVMSITNPSKRNYLDVKSQDDKITEEVANSICKRSSGRSSECKSQVTENPSSIKQFLARNYRRTDFFVLSIHKLTILESESSMGDISFSRSVVYEDIGVLGVFIASGLIFMLGIMIIFTSIAVSIVLIARNMRPRTPKEDHDIK